MFEQQKLILVGKIFSMKGIPLTVVTAKWILHQHDLSNDFRFFVLFFFPMAQKFRVKGQHCHFFFGTDKGVLYTREDEINLQPSVSLWFCGFYLQISALGPAETEVMVSPLCLVCGSTSDVNPGTRPRYSQVVDEDFKKPNNQTNK